MKKLLAINLSSEKKDVIWQICDRIGMIPQEVPRAYWGMKVRDLCSEKELEEADNITYSGRDLNMDMIVLEGISSRELDIFLDGYKSSGLDPVKLKSMVTDTNSNWTIEQLYSELAKEYLFYRMRGR